ncbi:MAG: ATP-binding protein [Thermodesulfobacteriota bacterium]
MTLRDDIELLVRQNEALVKTLAIMGVRLDSSLKLLSAITSLTALPIRTMSLSEAAGEILEVLVRELSDIYSCSLMLYQPDREVLTLLAARGQADLLGEINGPYNKDLVFRPGEGIAGRVFQANEPIFWDRNSTEAGALKKDPPQFTPESLACLPLPVLGCPIGVLNISFGAPTPFDHPRKRDLMLLSGVVANVLQTFHLKFELDEKARSLQNKVTECETEISERRRFEEALRRSREELERRVHERTADLASANLTLRREVEERQRTAAELQKSEKRYRDLFASITDFIFTHDMDGCFLSLNPYAAQTLGYNTEDLVGRYMGDFMLPKHGKAFREDYLDQIGRIEELTGTFILLDKTGGEHYIEYRCGLVEDLEQGRYVSGTGRDITDRILAQRELRSLEEQLIQSQKMQAVGTLASGIAHDFNNILQAVSGYIQLLLTKPMEPEVGRRYLVEVETAVKRAGELVMRLLTFSRKVEPRLEPMVLNQEIYQAVRMLERIIPRMIEIETYLDPTLWSIKGDANQLEQVLMNLGTNARDAMAEGGRIVIETRNVVLNDNNAGAYLELPPGRYVELKFTDTGQGMDEEVIKHIFEPFFTTKDPGEGTGLGLSTVYGIVKGHGGHVTVNSEPGRGAAFHLYLPALVKAEAEMDQEGAESEELPGGTEVILLVDDERAILEIVKSFLERYGYQLITADGGERALELYRERRDEVDLVVLDLGMPGMGGHSCLKEILALNPGAKVLIASGYTTKKHEKDVIESGAAGFVGKPYKLTDLLKVIRRVLDG